MPIINVEKSFDRPLNLYLTTKYNCHINTEICSSVWFFPIIHWFLEIRWFFTKDWENLKKLHLSVSLPSRNLRIRKGLLVIFFLLWKRQQDGILNSNLKISWHKNLKTLCQEYISLIYFIQQVTEILGNEAWSDNST